MILPGHGLPPLAGAGLVQVRLLVQVPLPHVVLHVPQDNQLAQYPSAIQITNIILEFCYYMYAMLSPMPILSLLLLFLSINRFKILLHIEHLQKFASLRVSYWAFSSILEINKKWCHAFYRLSISHRIPDRYFERTLVFYKCPRFYLKGHTRLIHLHNVEPVLT